MIRLNKTLPPVLPISSAQMSVAPLHSAEQMQRMIMRERLRSDRGTSHFSLAVFSLPSPCNPTDLASVERACQQRLRLTDDVGMLDRRSVAVLLPDTRAEGAWKVVSDLRQMFPPTLREVACEVYSYPSNPDESDKGPTAPSEPIKRGPSRQRLRRRQMRATRAAIAGESSSVQTLVGQGSARRAVPMQTLFLQPLPWWKRTIDIAAAGLGLLVISPLLLAVAATIKLTSPGPVFFCQQRDGHGGRKFWIYKFRTMVINADALKAQLRSKSEQDGPAFKLKSDPRVLPFGRFLRRTCLDELPQLLNVLRGDMTLVGPRPMCSKEASQCTPWQRRRLDVTPGLTCIWQVEGGAKVTFLEWMRMDLRYAAARSLWNDLTLLVRTVPAIVRRDGVY